MTHRPPSRLLAAALGAGLLLSGAPAATAAPVQADRAPHGVKEVDRSGRDAGRALEKLRRAVLADVTRADGRVVKAATLSAGSAGLTDAHRDALLAAAAAVRADLAELRASVAAAESGTRLLALRRAVPSSAGAHLAAVTRLVAAADSAVAASLAADVLLVSAYDAAVAAGKDVSSVQDDVSVRLAAATAARVKAAGDAEAALSVGRALADRRLPAAVKTVSRSVAALRSATDDVEDLTDEVEDLPAPAPVADTPAEPVEQAPEAPVEQTTQTPAEDEAPAEPTV